MSPTRLLATELTQRGANLQGGYGTMAGITTRQLANAICGRPLCAVAYLRLCSALQFDPCPELLHPPIVPADFDFAYFAMGFRISRGLRGHTHKQAADAIGVSPSTVCRIEAGKVMFIGVVTRACAYIGMSPFGYCIPQRIAQKTQAEPMPYGASLAVPRETVPANG